MFSYELITPDLILSSGQAHLLVLEASEGQLGLLKNHAPLVAQLNPGLMKVYDQDKSTEEIFFISRGFVSMMANHCTILADEAWPLKGITKELIQQRKKDLEKNSSEDSEEKREEIKIFKQVTDAMETVLKIGQ